MKTVTVAICKACNAPILNQPGVVLHGNLYELTSGAAIDPGPGAGLTPNVFPGNTTTLDGGSRVTMTPIAIQAAVGMEAYHVECLAGIIVSAGKPAEAGHAA
jgi:hypothetical protein